MSNSCAYCARPVLAKGMCSPHYRSFSRYGDPFKAKRSRQGITPEQRFWSSVDKAGEDDCWQWSASRNPCGYGMFKAGSTVTAHTFSWELHNGPRPARTGVRVEDWTVDHICHTTECTLGKQCPHRSCVNPRHLRLIPWGVNVAEGTSFSAVNARKTHCKWGHEFTPENSYGYGGNRQCKTCAREASRARRARLKKPE